MRKKEKGIRPVAVGNIFRHVVSKIACRPAMRSLCSSLSPIQLDVGIRGVCEAAVHATTSLLKDPGPTQRVIVKLDLYNVFSSVGRNYLIETCIRLTSLPPGLQQTKHSVD